jgi:ABC-type sugar transport system permease subunit
MMPPGNGVTTMASYYQQKWQREQRAHSSSMMATISLVVVCAIGVVFVGMVAASSLKGAVTSLTAPIHHISAAR